MSGDDAGGAPGEDLRGHRLVALRLAEAFTRQASGGFRLVARGTEITDAETGGAYCPEFVLFHGDAEIHTVVEVASSDCMGERYARRARCYRSIPSLRNYVTVTDDRPRIAWFTRRSDREWLFGVAEDAKAEACLDSPAVLLKLAEVYEGVLPADAQFA